MDENCIECGRGGASWDSDYKASICTPCFMRLREECDCDDGKVWNNADPTSGQYHECEECDWEVKDDKGTVSKVS